MSRYLIGIDLGTTNSALAYVDTREKVTGTAPRLQTFKVPQVVAAGHVGEADLLSSFLYLPGPHDLPPGWVVQQQSQRWFRAGCFAALARRCPQNLPAKCRTGSRFNPPSRPAAACPPPTGRSLSPRVRSPTRRNSPRPHHQPACPFRGRD